MNIAVDHLANLAKLSLNEEEKKRLEADLTGIMTYVDQLGEVDTEDIAEITHAASEINVLRADEVSEKKEENNAEAAAVLRNAFPESEEGYIRVPLVINKK